MLLNSYIILMKKIWHYLVENAQTEMYPLFFILTFFMKSFPMIYPCFFEQPASNHWFCLTGQFPAVIV